MSLGMSPDLIKETVRDAVLDALVVPPAVNIAGIADPPAVNVSKLARVVEATMRPFAAGSLAVNGIQYGSIANASVAANYTATAARAFNVAGSTYGGALQELEFGLTAAFQGNATCLMEYQWQARNLGVGEWLPICGNEATPVTTAWAESTMSGRFTPDGDTINTVPFEIRMVFKTNHADLGIARVKNSSYAKAIYRLS